MPVKGYLAPRFTVVSWPILSASILRGRIPAVVTARTPLGRFGVDPFGWTRVYAVSRGEVSVDAGGGAVLQAGSVVEGFDVGEQDGGSWERVIWVQSPWR